MSDSAASRPSDPLPPGVLRWQQVVAAQPANQLARFSLAKALFDTGRYPDANQHFETLLQSRPDWMVVQILLGKSLHALGELPKARESFLKARQLAIEQHHDGPLEEVEQWLAEHEAGAGPHPSSA